MSDDEREPPYLYPDYVGTRLRAPARPLVQLPEGFHDFPAPLFPREIAELDHDLTRRHAGEPIGERIIVTGRVVDSHGRPLRQTIVEIWQANAAGRYLDQDDQHPAPLDPNFSGAGRCLTDGEGRVPKPAGDADVLSRRPADATGSDPAIDPGSGRSRAVGVAIRS